MTPCQTSPIVTDAPHLSRRVTGNVTGVLEKNLGKTVFVTLSRLKTPGRGASPRLVVIIVIVIVILLSSPL
jgi:hypothetical protein